VNDDDLPSFLAVRKWADPAMRIWMQEQAEYALCNNAETRKLVRDATGSWPALIQMFHEAFTQVHLDPQRAISVLAERFATAAQALPLLKSLGLSDATDLKVKVIKILKDFGTASLVDVGAYAELPTADVERVFTWAEYLGYIEQSGGSTFTIDPILAGLLSRG
jgi:hypothetical protein